MRALLNLWNPTTTLWSPVRKHDWTYPWWICRRHHEEKFILLYNYSNYRDMYLTHDETFFIVHHCYIDHYRQDDFCIDKFPPSLQNLCLYQILRFKPKNPNLKAWIPLLPKLLLSRHENERQLKQQQDPMPNCDPKCWEPNFFTRVICSTLFYLN